MKKLLVVVFIMLVLSSFVFVFASSNENFENEEEPIKKYNYNLKENPQTLQDYQYNLVKVWWRERDKATNQQERYKIKDYYSSELKKLREEYGK